MSETFAGRCACGTATYRLLAPPMIVHACHCSECQRLTGSAFAVNALVEGACVERLTGDLIEQPVPTTSGRPHILTRCAACGTTLWSDYGARGWMLFVRVGTLDEPGRWPPNVHIFTASKPAWLPLPAEAPAYRDFYDDMPATWGAEAWGRRLAAQAADAARHGTPDAAGG